MVRGLAFVGWVGRLDVMSHPKDVADAVLAEMALGVSLRQACIKHGTTAPTFLRWCAADADLAEQYARARTSMIDAIADDTIRLADEPPERNPVTGAVDSGSVAKQRLQVDTRKWLLSKLAPKQYGDRLEVAGDKDAPLALSVAVEFVKPKPGG